MKSNPLAWAAAAALAAIVVVGSMVRPAAQPAAAAFVAVAVLPMDRDVVLTNQTVVVRDGRIVAVTADQSAKIPEGAVRIDAKGKFLMPGLAEMHAHVPGGNAPDAAIERTLFLYAANGVTTIRGMLGDPRQIGFRDRAAKGEIVSPRMFLAGPSFSGNTAPTAAAAVEMVAAQKKAGYDLLKIHPGVKRDVFDALAARADELKIPFAGHVPLEVGVHRALEARYKSIDHLDGYIEALAKNPSTSQFFGVNLINEVNEAGIAALVKETRAAGVWQVPTQVLMDNLLNDVPAETMAERPEMKFMLNPGEVQKWIAQKKSFLKYSQADRAKYLTVRRRIIKALHDAGVPFALGSDAPQWWNVPGFSVHRELQSLVDAGLTPYQALKTGTANIGSYFGTPDGVVAAGRRADLVLLDANPIESIANSSRIAGVMVNGRWLSKADIDKRLAGGS